MSSAPRHNPLVDVQASLRAAWSDSRSRLPRKSELRKDGVAGLTGAIGSVPDGMAAGVLAGVNPIYGLYASTLGPIVGGALSSTRLMVVTTTSAGALAAGESISGLSGEERAGALFLLVFLIGIFQILAAVLRLSRFTRFVSHSVMVGFLTGVAVLMALGQLSDFTGYEPSGGNKITQTLDLLLHVGQIHLPTLLVGVSTMALVVVLRETRLRQISALLALAVPSVLVALLGADSIELVRDVGDIPRGIPLPELPTLSLLSTDLITGAAAIAAIIVVQGAGVSQTVPNRDGAPIHLSRDFLAQGAANMASGLFKGMPVGGSVSQTALRVSAGAVTRWTAILSGVWMAIILLALPGLVGRVAMPCLAALLLLAAYRTIDVHEALSIWRTELMSRIAIVATFAATLFLPIQIAVGIGVLLTAIMYLNRLSTDVQLVEMVQLSDGRVEEREPPKTLPSDAITMLDVYGSLFYAGARTFEARLPSARGSTHPVVLLRLRGRTKMGATLIDILDGYARQLAEVGGRLYLTEVDEHAYLQMSRTGKLTSAGPVSIYLAGPIVDDATRRAYLDALAWLRNPEAARNLNPIVVAATPLDDGSGAKVVGEA